MYHHDLNVIRTDEFVDSESETFFMRVAFSGYCQNEKIIKGLEGILPDSAQVTLSDDSPKNIVILATKEHHCLSDLLIRNEYKDLNFNILAIISNHESLASLADKFKIPFFYINHIDKTRQKHEQEILEKIQTFQPDYLVLAKYMRILSSDFTSNFSNKIINIHHSFLPAFIGANPYKQAAERGVKIIGATAHFVNENLDEGPILTQDIIRVNHSKTWQEMAAAGRDIERNVLARTLKLVFEDRVFVINNKTVIFE